MTNLAWKTMIKGICQSLSCVVCVTRARFADTGASPPHGATAARCLPLEWPLVYRCALPVLCGLRVRDARVGAAQIIRVRC